MREFDLDDNDPLSMYLKTIMKVEAPNSLLPRNANPKTAPRDNKDDSISDAARRRSENINQVETDIESDKLRETEVSKQMDYGNDLFAALILCCQEIILA